MKKTKLTVKIIALLLLIIAPFLMIFSVAFLTEPEFDASFVGAFDEKLERLYSIEEEKIVIIGGSSTAFGYDSAMIEKYLDMPVVNMGLYAALGTKVMLDLTADAIGAGDIVIIAPELDAQTLSLYFSASTTLRALDGSPEYLLEVKEENRLSLLGQSWSFATDKLAYKLFGGEDESGIYRADSFNERGDISVYRAENTMDEYYQKDKLIELDKKIVDSEFLDYLNAYIAHCRSVGASVYFEFCPMNSLALSAGSQSEESRYAFEDYLRKNLDCTLIASSIEDYIYEPGYFYDTNFHLNSAGVTLHTVNVVRDLLLELGIPTQVKEEIPKAPPLPEIDVKYFGTDINADSFLYEKKENGSYKIVGVSPSHRADKTLTVPLGYNGYKVTEIGAGAFSDCSVEKLIITEDTNITYFERGAFSRASQLSSLYIYYPHEEDILPPPDFNGTKDSFKVYVPSGSAYKNGYYWSQCGVRFEYID